MKPKKSKAKKRKVATLKVPAAYYDEALAFVNARRKEKGLRRIKNLPAGYPGDSESCPCAAKCGAPISVEQSGWDWVSKFSFDCGGLDSPSGFIGFFDTNSKGGVLTLPVRSTKTKELVS